VRIARERGGWSVHDLDSRNGTFVDGRPLTAGAWFEGPILVRIGKSLLWAIDDVGPFAGETRRPRMAGGPIVGAGLRRAYGEIALAARAGDTLTLRGESGSGKELAARAFHDARHGTSSDAPFVAVNCAAIPEGLAERLLFGARKGSYSGATADADGYVQSADGGTLFLDEIAELDPLVQAKLLRVLETREVMPLGASRSRKVTITVCAASHKPLRDEVAGGRFREDLYFRIARPEVVVPPLRERIDEIPAFVARAAADVDARLSASVGLVERCCLRPWPGNVRELLQEIRRASHAALHDGAVLVDIDHLAAEAGLPLAREPAERAPAPAPKAEAPQWTDDDVRRALAENGGNVRGTARSLGLHRNQVRRWLAKHPDAQGPSEPDRD
jgi:transcriptional regulator with PAS, ATPase and Fis domain